jgi:hypothetical protein
MNDLFTDVTPRLQPQVLDGDDYGANAATANFGCLQCFRSRVSGAVIMCTAPAMRQLRIHDEAAAGAKACHRMRRKPCL